MGEPGYKGYQKCRAHKKGVNMMITDSEGNILDSETEHNLDRQIRKVYFTIEECQRQRLRMERIWHPDRFTWHKPGDVPVTSALKREVLTDLGFGEEFLTRMELTEKEAQRNMKTLVETHCLWPHFKHIKGFSFYLAGAFIAAGGEIERTEKVSSFWKGMGLDILPDGSVPRKTRGRGNTARKVPAIPFVTRVGEQIRQQLLRSKGNAYDMYLKFKAEYTAKYPARAKIFNHKAAQRAVQKRLYSCLWREWRLGNKLSAPDPYAFDILKHNSQLIRIQDFYDK